ncbi:MAG TPA: sigma-54 dependent transcriptional regulator [Candidatus Nanoarchaeia archaeon]|nr:sigma-54 dependent transcriptional regulator [Candidatus Nanoarchaeia archaeon]
MAESRYGMIGQSEAMLKVFRDIEKINCKGKKVSVFIVGETGTGKELVARAIHDHGPRREGKIVTVDSSCISNEIAESLLFGHSKGAFTGATESREGYFRAAQGGTLFFDEIGNMPLSIQAKLLRALEDGYYPVGSNKIETSDVHCISASNQSLLDLVRADKFREDLYYRLGGFTISLPPLRERREDIEPLTAYFMKQYSPGAEITSDALKLLNSYHWPGNVRQLRNVLETAIITAENDVIKADDIQSRLAKPESKEKKTIAAMWEQNFPSNDTENFPTLEEVGISYMRHVLKAVGGRATAAATILETSVRNLQYKMARILGE